MTLSDDRPDLSDFPKPFPQHQCFRNGGVSCEACAREEQAEEQGLCARCGYDLHEFGCPP